MTKDAHNKIIVLITSCPNMKTADKISTTLVEKGYAACVSSYPGVHSTYMWEGSLQKEQEVILVIKTVEPRYKDIESLFETSLHPYQVPELLVFSPQNGLPNYLDWIRSLTTSQKEQIN